MRRYAPHRATALERAQARVGDGYQAGWCLRFALYEAYGVAPFVLDAVTYWTEAVERGEISKARSGELPKTAPPGALVLWTGGAHGHAAIYAGDGQVITTDHPVRGRVGLAPIETIADQWGYKLAGWVKTDGAGWILTC